MAGAMGTAAAAAAAIPPPGPLGPVFDPTAFKQWIQMAYATAFQAARRQKQVAGAAGQWRIRRRGTTVGAPPSVGAPGTLLGSAAPTFGSGYGRTFLGAT